VAALATIPLGTELDAKAEIGALAGIVSLALAVEGVVVRKGRLGGPSPQQSK
jgi:hypothetical protein